MELHIGNDPGAVAVVVAYLQRILEDYGLSNDRERFRVGLALSEDGLWVANQLDRTVSLVDVRRRRVAHTIEVGGAPVELAVGAGGVWAAVDG